jgi:hypothetical protein
VEALENVYPFKREHALAYVADFLPPCRFLINDNIENESSQSDLLDLIEKFARLALRMWRRRVVISVGDMSHFGGQGQAFWSETPEMDGDSIARSAGHDLHSRPITAVCRALIASMPVDDQGQYLQGHWNIWWKAKVRSAFSAYVEEAEEEPEEQLETEVEEEVEEEL